MRDVHWAVLVTGLGAAFAVVVFVLLPMRGGLSDRVHLEASTSVVGPALASPPAPLWVCMRRGEWMRVRSLEQHEQAAVTLPNRPFLQPLRRAVGPVRVDAISPTALRIMDDLEGAGSQRTSDTEAYRLAMALSQAAPGAVDLIYYAADAGLAAAADGTTHLTRNAERTLLRLRARAAYRAWVREGYVYILCPSRVAGESLRSHAQWSEDATAELFAFEQHFADSPSVGLSLCQRSPGHPVACMAP